MRHSAGIRFLSDKKTLNLGNGADNVLNLGLCIVLVKI